jgi:hypothetical protein
VQRIVLIVVVLFIAWRILSSRGKRMMRSAPGADDFSRFSFRRKERRLRRQRENASQLVPCAGCGVFVPVERAVAAGDGALYCSDACRDEAEAGGA